MTKTDIANIALNFLGAKKINDITEGSDHAKRCNLLYGPVAETILKKREWKDAIAYTYLTTEAYDEYTSHASNNSSGDTTLEATTDIASDTPLSGTVTVVDASGNETDYSYTSYSGAIFTLSSSLLENMDDTYSIRVTPNTREAQYAYMYDLPSDCLKALDLNRDDTEPRLVENDYLYTNLYSSSDGVLLRYIKDVRDEVSGSVVYGDDLGYAIALQLAAELAPAINPEMLDRAMGAAKIALDKAIAADAEESHHRTEITDWWFEV